MSDKEVRIQDDLYHAPVFPDIRNDGHGFFPPDGFDYANYTSNDLTSLPRLCYDISISVLGGIVHVGT